MFEAVNSYSATARVHLRKIPSTETGSKPDRTAVRPRAPVSFSIISESYATST